MDINCFIVQADKCNPITYEETTAMATIRYSITADNLSCIFTKEIVNLNEKEDSTIQKIMKGKKLECIYISGQFNDQWTTSLIEGLEDCQGELKEAIGQLLLLV